MVARHRLKVLVLSHGQGYDSLASNYNIGPAADFKEHVLFDLKGQSKACRLIYSTNRSKGICTHPIYSCHSEVRYLVARGYRTIYSVKLMSLDLLVPLFYQVSHFWMTRVC